MRMISFLSRICRRRPTFGFNMSTPILAAFQHKSFPALCNGSSECSAEASALKDENATTSRDPISARPGIGNYRFKQSPPYIMAFCNVDDVVQEQNIIEYNYIIVI